MLELALTLSLLFSITFGLIEYGYYFYVKNTMEGAAREGCRGAIVAGATLSAANIDIENQLQVANLVPSGTTASGGSGSYTIGNYSVTYKDSTTGTTVSTLSSPILLGHTLTVTITATWGTVGAGFRPMALIGASKTVTCASSMRIEGQGD
ncbi:MAG TPA: TadE/TadG family type IV pilus assembly protein [Tepidisphaeraceae bacterium]|nr:TadE/TadG family type IV pilus assembly protein [Tepidisphaeraceae bacterium]